jgi:uncharacterized protein DUF3306
LTSAAPPVDFWSRRKARVEAEAQADVQAEQARAEAAELALQEQKTDAELLVELELPDPDTLQPGDNIVGFMAKAVPERLRRRALRQLWRINPVLANVDGLVDYGQDFSDSALAVENLQTAYQVGKGMLKHVEEMARQAEAKLAKNAEQQTDASPDALVALQPEQSEIKTDETAEPAETAPSETPDLADMPADTDAAPALISPLASLEPVAETASDEAPPLSRRRMQFHFSPNPKPETRP